MMRVALVIAGPYPAFRGSQVLVQQLARGLTERGHEVELVSYGRWLQSRPGLHPARLVLDPVLLLRLWYRVRRRDVDVIHAHNYEAAIAGLLVSRLTGRPLVYHGHSALAEELPTYVRHRWARAAMRRLGAWLDAQVPRRAAFCIAVTDELGEMLRRAGAAPGAVACIPPAATPKESEAISPQTRAGDHICYAGNLDGYQNLGFLFAVFARVRERHPAARLVLLTHEARVRIEVPAGVDVVCARSYAEVHAHLTAAAVAVCPRTERSGFPMKLLNYMAAGKAIVASAGSAKGIIDHVTGRVVEDGDVEGFARVLGELLDDAGQRSRLGEAARAAVESPDAWRHVFERLEAVYWLVLSPQRRRLEPAAAAQ